MTDIEKKELRERLAARTKAEMDSWWADPEFRRGYAAWEKEYEAAVAMHKAREKAGLTQLDLAERMNTKRSNVSRMENGQNVTFATFARYMMGCGFDFRISIFPMKGERPTGGFRISGARRSQRQPAYAVRQASKH